MKKVFFSLLLVSITSFAQQKDDLISKISTCLLNATTEQEELCIQKYLSSKSTVAGSDWVFLKEQGKILDPRDLHEIMFESTEEFPAGCTTLIAFRDKAVQTKVCAPDNTGVPQIKTSCYNYKLTEPGSLQLLQGNVENNDSQNSADCSLLNVANNEYLICRMVDENNVKLVLSYQKSSRKI